LNSASAQDGPSRYSATGEENIIEHQSGDQMNDLEYPQTTPQTPGRRIDLEDLSTGVSIADSP